MKNVHVRKKDVLALVALLLYVFMINLKSIESNM